MRNDLQSDAMSLREKSVSFLTSVSIVGCVLVIFSFVLSIFFKQTGCDLGQIMCELISPAGFALGSIFCVLNLAIWAKIAEVMLRKEKTPSLRGESSSPVNAFTIATLVSIKLGILAGFVYLIIVPMPDQKLSSIFSFIICLLSGSMLESVKMSRAS